MRPFRREVENISEYRAAHEIRLSTLLKQAGSSLTVEEYKQAIFNGPDVAHFRAYLLEALELFDCSDIDSASDEIIAAIQDAWNYFPHRSLNGRCPEEIMAEELQKRRP